MKMNGGPQKRAVAVVVFLAGTALAGLWAWWSGAGALWPPYSRYEGIGAVSIGISSIWIPVALGAVVLSLLATIKLTRKAGPGLLPTFWRRTHIVTTIGMLVAPFVGGLGPILVLLALFLPAQLFFANGSLALWFARPDVPINK